MAQHCIRECHDPSAEHVHISRFHCQLNRDATLQRSFRCSLDDGCAIPSSPRRHEPMLQGTL